MKRKIILASTSPRRHTLLKNVVEEFSVCAPTLAEEVLDPTLALPQALEKLAQEKAMSVAKTVPEALVIGADTIVCKDGKRLGKPQDETEARAMLRDLSDATHEVITAVAMVCVESNTVVTNHYVSEVTFRALTEEDISVYIATGEPMDKADGQIWDTNELIQKGWMDENGRWKTNNGMPSECFDKAGAYGIQGEGGKFVTHLSGDFENVVGLPTVLVREMLEEALK